MPARRRTATAGGPWWVARGEEFRVGAASRIWIWGAGERVVRRRARRRPEGPAPTMMIWGLLVVGLERDGGGLPC